MNKPIGWMMMALCAGSVVAQTVQVKNVQELDAALVAVTNVPGAPREIVLAAGDYFLVQPIELSPAHSNVVLRGAGPDKTTLYGGIPVTGWTKEEGSPFWQAKLPEPPVSSVLNRGLRPAYTFRTLVKDGALAPIATCPGGTNRFEHLGQFKVSIMSSLQGGWQRKPTDAERRTMPYKPADLPDTMDLMNADVRLYHMWSDSLCTVSNVDRAAHTLWTAQPASWAMGAGDRRKYEVLNVREGMKEPGQWYLDRKTGTVHYWPKPGEDLAKIRFVAPTLPYVLAVGTGKQRWNRKTWTHGVRIADLSVTAAAPDVKEMASFGGSEITAALRVDCVTRCVVENVTVANVGGAGIAFQDAEESRLVNCDVHDVGARGIGLGGWAGCRDNLILSNRVCDVGRVFRSSCGVNAGGSNEVVCANEICRIPYCGIIGGGSDNLFENNYIHHVMQVLHDGGAIYGNLTRCVLRGNVVHDVVPDGLGYGVHAYYADEGSRDCVVENNYAEGVGTPIHNHMTYRTTVRNNTFVFKGDMRISFARSYDCAFSNNTLVCGGALTLGEPDAVPHWEGNFAVRPRDAKNALSRREIGEWRPERPQQKRKWRLSAPRVAAPPTLDGVFGPTEWPLNWSALDRTPDRHASGFTGATCRFAWDDANLYVSVMAAAFKNSRMSIGSTWGRDDGVEVVFADGRRIRAYYSGKTEIVPVAFAVAGVRVWAGKDPTIKHKWENQNKANYEIAIPWSALGVTPKAGLKIPFNACAYMSEFDQYKYFEGTAPYPDGRPADDPAGIVMLEK